MRETEYFLYRANAPHLTRGEWERLRLPNTRPSPPRAPRVFEDMRTELMEKYPTIFALSHGSDVDRQQLNAELQALKQQEKEVNRRERSNRP